MKKNILFIIAALILSIISIFAILQIMNAVKKSSLTSESISLKKVASEIMADGQVRSQNEAVMHFQIAGKAVYLPFKEGDLVKQGQTVVSLDSYATQKQLEAALNTYRSVRDTFDQVQDNNKNNYLDAQQANPYPLNYFNLGGIGNNDKTNAVNDMIKRIIDQNQANLDNSVIQVQLANYAFTLSTLTSPINGVLVHQDISTPQVMVTPQNTFTIIDPDLLIFRANISENDVNFVQEGNEATIQLNGVNDKIIGTILKIYPEKITLPTGENVYQVDIEGLDIKKLGKYKQGGIVLIKNKYDTTVVLVPSWLVLSKQYIWVTENGNTKLKAIKTGETVGGNTEILDGLNDSDKIILNPSSLIKNKYPLL